MAKTDGKYARQLHRGPATLFSVPALSQVQCRAPCLPHEQVALEAQTQASPERPQHVDGSDGAIADSGGFEGGNYSIELSVIALVVIDRKWSERKFVEWSDENLLGGESFLYRRGGFYR